MFIIKRREQSVVAQAYNTSVLEAEPGGESDLPIEFQDSLECRMGTCLISTVPPKRNEFEKLEL